MGNNFYPLRNCESYVSQQIISIKGKNIEIRYYSQDEIMLMGEFTSIIFS